MNQTECYGCGKPCKRDHCSACGTPVFQYEQKKQGAWKILAVSASVLAILLTAVLVVS